MSSREDDAQLIRQMLAYQQQLDALKARLYHREHDRQGELQLRHLVYLTDSDDGLSSGDHVEHAIAEVGVIDLDGEDESSSCDLPEPVVVSSSSSSSVFEVAYAKGLLQPKVEAVVAPLVVISDGESTPSLGNSAPFAAEASACHLFAPQTVNEGPNASVSRLVKRLEKLTKRVLAIDTDHCSVRYGNPRGKVAAAILDRADAALEGAMSELVESEMTHQLIQPVLQLHRAATGVHHPDLKATLTSPLQILGGVLNSLPERVGGMPRTSRPCPRDGQATDAFIAALDLMTTSCSRQRLERIDQVLICLKSHFRPKMVLRQSKRRTETTNATVTWAGRVMILAAQTTAYAIGNHARNQDDRLSHVVGVIAARHTCFSALFERTLSILAQPSTRLNPRVLDMHDESRRIQDKCAQVAAM